MCRRGTFCAPFQLVRAELWASCLKPAFFCAWLWAIISEWFRAQGRAWAYLLNSIDKNTYSLISFSLSKDTGANKCLSLHSSNPSLWSPWLPVEPRVLIDSVLEPPIGMNREHEAPTAQMLQLTNCMDRDSSKSRSSSSITRKTWIYMYMYTYT